MSGPIIVTIPVKTENPLHGGIGNSKLAAIVQSRRNAEERKVCRMILMAPLTPAREGLFGWPLRILMTRFSCMEMDDDNLGTTLKHVRDAIADALGVRNDNDKTKVRFFYDQRKVKRGVHGVEVRVEPYQLPA